MTDLIVAGPAAEHSPPVDGPSPLQQRIAERLMARRLSLGLSPGTLARLAGLSRQQVTRIEQMTRSPMVETLAAIASALGTTVGALVDDDPPDDLGALVSRLPSCQQQAIKALVCTIAAG